MPETRLPGLYAGAELLVFPTLYEGFGLPPLEAMACGTPVLASNIPVLRETLGNAAALLSDCEVEAWSHAIDELLGNSGRLEELRRLGRERAALFTWQKTAGLTWEVYRKAAS